MSFTVQETTFNKAIQADGLRHFSDTTAWLNALYTEASLKKFDQNELYHIISNEISFEKLSQKINYTFKDKKNLIKTLMQSTFCYEMKETTLQSNERLEFLGDSLINFIVGKNLFHKYLSNDEGDLSKLRGALVNEEKLAELARTIDLGNFVFLGKGEMRTGGAEKDSILADTFEALFAGIYFDSNNHIETLEIVFKTIVELFEAKNKVDFYSINQLEVFDTKSKLQELTMAAHGAFPTYKGVELPNNGGYKVEVWLGDKMLAEMTGPSKKKIEKLLAKKIIDEKLY
ncbi:MAG: ribonuclease III [Rhizobacter sp.]|nr:ribonuclease III [Bacteriovorax sp.]